MVHAFRCIKVSIAAQNVIKKEIMKCIYKNERLFDGPEDMQ